MKCRPRRRSGDRSPSCPARGTWIEMLLFSRLGHLHHGRAPQGARGLKFERDVADDLLLGRAPQGARGLKCQNDQTGGGDVGRAPQGARGLKYQYPSSGLRRYRSCPARGTWIEIAVCDAYNGTLTRSRAPQGARGLKCGLSWWSWWWCPSCPARGTWIEINISFRVDKLQIGRAPQGARGLK